MVDFGQFLMIFFIDIGLVYQRGRWERHGGGMGGGKSLNIEAR